jgi:large subunit ribosomal protein L25
MLEIQVKERNVKKKPKALREKGIIPAVYYGPKEDATAVEINAKKFEKVWKETGGSAIVVIKGIGEDKEALIHEVDLHPITGIPQHADLYVIERGKKIEVEIPIEFIGEAPAEKAGHVIVKVLYEVEIEVRPSDLPQHLEVDISNLAKVGDSISVGDISLPESGEFITDKNETVIAVKEAVEEIEPVVEETSSEEISKPSEGEEDHPADTAIDENQVKE